MNTYQHIPGIKGLVSTDFAHWSPQLEQACKSAGISTPETDDEGRIRRISAKTLHQILPHLRDGALNPFEWAYLMQHLRANSPARFKEMQGQEITAVFDTVYRPGYEENGTVDKKNGILVLSPRLGAGTDREKYISGKEVKISLPKLEEQLKERGIELYYKDSPSPKKEYAVLGYASYFGINGDPVLSIGEQLSFTGNTFYNAPVDNTSFIPIKRTAYM